MTVFFFSNFEIGGAQKIAISLINKLYKKDKNFNKIISVNKYGKLKKNINRQIKIYDFNKKRLIHCVIEYLKYIDKNNVKKIFCVQPHNAILCYFLNIFLKRKIKIIARETNSYKENKFRTFSFKERIFILLKKFVYKKLHLVVCPSKGIQKEIDGNKIFISNFVDIKNLMKIKSREKNYILSIGRLVKQKRYQDLIEAFNLIHNEISEKLIIIGEGPEKKRLKNLINKLKLNKRIKIIPFKSYLTYLSNCKVYIQTSAWEGMPNILIEALVLKKKIVSTNCLHGPKEILRNGKYGYLCNVGDVKEISKAIKIKLNEKKINIPDNFINNFSIKIAANKYYKILK